MIRILARCPEFRILSVGLDLKSGEVGELPASRKWQARAEFWERQGLVQILEGDTAPERTEEPEAKAKKTRKKRTPKKTEES